MSGQIITSDMYEVAYYLTLGFTIENIELINENKNLICNFTVTGENINSARIDYFNAKAFVNLLDFRRAYQRVSTLGISVKKEAKKQASNKSGGIQ